jgi:hypothetical protein
LIFTILTLSALYVKYLLLIFKTYSNIIGVAQGTLGSEDRLLYHNIRPILYELPNLISLYHNYQDIQLIVELLFECTNGSEPILLHITEVK